MFALVSAIESLLREREGQDSAEYNAWKLSEIAKDMLGDATAFNTYRVLVTIKSIEEVPSC